MFLSLPRIRVHLRLVPSIACRSMVPTGREDPVTPPELGRALAQSLSQGRFAEIQEAGHLPRVGAPLELAHLIRTPLEDTVP